jgi:hypothetical protein
MVRPGVSGSNEAQIMTLNPFEQAIVKNAHWFVAREDSSGFINVPADEYYGVTGDASLIGHAVSVRTMGWVLTRDDKLLESARRSAEWLARRQDKRGGWHHDAGYALDAAQCVFEGFCTYERLTSDHRFHDVMVRAADRMIAGTLNDKGELSILNLSEVGEYAHFCFLAWKQTGEERFRDAGLKIVAAITANFDEHEGYWNTAVEPEPSAVVKMLRPWLSPVLRASIAYLNIKGKTIAKMSEHLLPMVMRGHGPQYGLGLMDAQAVLDTLDGKLELSGLRAQTARAVEWAAQHCSGPVTGSLVESRKVPANEAVYPLPAINDSEHASLWPTCSYLLALIALDDWNRYGERADAAARWILSVQDDDGSFWTHQDRSGRRFGEKYGNINYYGSLSLWLYSTRRIFKAE